MPDSSTETHNFHFMSTPQSTSADLNAANETFTGFCWEGTAHLYSMKTILPAIWSGKYRSDGRFHQSILFCGKIDARITLLEAPLCEKPSIIPGGMCNGFHSLTRVYSRHLSWAPQPLAIACIYVFHFIAHAHPHTIDIFILRCKSTIFKMCFRMAKEERMKQCL